MPHTWASCLTQEDMAARLKVNQGRISRLEHGPQVKLTTLARYVRAMGGRLQIAAVFRDGTSIEIGPIWAPKKRTV